MHLSSEGLISELATRRLRGDAGQKLILTAKWNNLELLEEATDIGVLGEALDELIHIDGAALEERTKHK